MKRKHKSSSKNNFIKGLGIGLAIMSIFILASFLYRIFQISHISGSATHCLPPTDPAYIQAYGKWERVTAGGLSFDFPTQSFSEEYKNNTWVEMPAKDTFNNLEQTNSSDTFNFGRQVSFDIKVQQLIEVPSFTSPYLSKSVKNIYASYLSQLHVDPIYLVGRFAVSKIILPPNYQYFTPVDLMHEINLRSGLGSQENCKHLYGSGSLWVAGSTKSFMMDNSAVAGYQFVSDMCYPTQDGGAGADPEYFFKLNNQIYLSLIHI